MQVLALILTGVAGGTIGILTNNNYLEYVRDADIEDLSSAGLDLQNLIYRSLSAASWLILLSIGVLLGEILGTVIVLVIPYIPKPLQLVIQIIVSWLLQ